MLLHINSALNQLTTYACGFIKISHLFSVNQATSLRSCVLNQQVSASSHYSFIQEITENHMRRTTIYPSHPQVPGFECNHPDFSWKEVSFELVFCIDFSALKGGFLIKAYRLYKMVQTIICIKTAKQNSYSILVSSYLSYTSFSPG